MTHDIATPLYFCNNCKKVFDSSDSLFLVEDNSTRAFCSDVCIEKFFAPLVEFYEKKVRSLRTIEGVESELCLDYVNKRDKMGQLLVTPDEIYLQENTLKEKIYIFIKKFIDDSSGGSEEVLPIYLIIYSLVFEMSPSFIIMATATSSDKLLQRLKIGRKLEDISDFTAKARSSTTKVMQIDTEVITLLESKRSSLLANLLSRRVATDIAFEKFHEYEKFYQDTLNNPDEIYSFQDKDGGNIFSYIKAHEEKRRSFYYIVLCVKSSLRDSSEEQGIFPVLSFPTTDVALYSYYRSGEKISGGFKN
ncbi:MAG TPA: hypothetical protein VI754_11215 [Bacteriovoracaceae bacterium]|nr:hypothetical protein [Bacteriovoracaceae bacterium]